MNIRLKVYNLVVECDPYIRDRYLLYKQRMLVPPKSLRGYAGKGWCLLSSHYRRWILREDRQRDQIPWWKGPESAAFRRELGSPGELAAALSAYDAVSFDIFDTLLFRPFARPVDLFHLVGQELNYLNYAALRHDMEMLCRESKQEQHGTGEVTLAEILAFQERRTGIPAEKAMEIEMRLERDLLYANPFLLEVFTRLLEQGKRIVITSDMYLPGEFLEAVLEKNGYTGYEKLFLSCQEGCGKQDGGLYKVVRAYLGEQTSCIHIGDNPHADIRMARANGFAARHYANVNWQGELYRPRRQSRMVGSAYAGIVNAWLHNGLCTYSRFYEFGFAMGGLFAVGYCRFIHEYTQAHGIQRVLFLSRDGDILKQVYDMLYPEADSVYTYWSRAAAAVLGADSFRFDYMRRFLFHKIDAGISTGEILKAMELTPELVTDLLKDASLKPEGLFDEQGCKALEVVLLDRWQDILDCYRDSYIAAKNYYEALLEGCETACTVDIGWAGSGGVILSHLVEEVWGLGCTLTGLIGGTSSPATDQPDSTEALMQSGKVTPYLFSQFHNRSIWETYDPPRRKHVLYFEALLASPTPGFTGFSLPADGKGYELRFGTINDRSKREAEETQAGILDFAREYLRHFGDYPHMFNISGWDAFAPFGAALGRKAIYFRKLFADSVFEPMVSGPKVPERM